MSTFQGHRISDWLKAIFHLKQHRNYREYSWVEAGTAVRKGGKE